MSKYVFLLFSIFSLLLSSCEDMFQSQIPMSSENDSLDSLFRSAEVITKLDAPTQLFAAPYYSDRQIHVTWNEVQNAAYYMIERAVAEPVSGSNPLRWEVPDEGNYEPLNRFVYGTSYIDVILRDPTLDSPEYQNKYFYRVSAFNTFERYDESDPAEPQSAMLFRAPVNVRASGGVSVEYVELSWEPAQGANSYEVWRSDFTNGVSASQLAIVPNVIKDGKIWFTNNVSALEQGKDFYYFVTARNSFGNRSLQTRPAYGYARMFGAPDDPKNVKVVDGRGHSTTAITVQWDKVDEDDAYYAVYRYSEEDSSLIRLADKIENKTELTDTTGLRPGVYYYYKVQAILDDISSGKQLKSQFSSDDPEGFLLSCPDGVEAVKTTSGGIIIRWRPAKGHEGERSQYTYKVYAGNSPEGDYLHLFASGVTHNPDANGYISTNEAPSGGYSFFKVATLNGLIESGQSAAVSPSPSMAVIQGASQYAFIQNENANSNGVYPVAITWKKPADDNPTYYHVQRSTRTEGGFTRINDAPLRADGLGSTGFSYNPTTEIYTFIDRNESARVGRKYYYRVLSLNQLEQGSFPSNERIGWGGLTHTQYILEFNKTMSSALKKLTLMYKSASTDKLGTETKNGTISGTIYYNAALQGLGARIIITLTNYADFYIENVPENGVYFILNGNSNTTANMSANGDMDGTITCTGMYPGKIHYGSIQIKGGAAGGGTYGVEPDGYSRMEVNYTVIN